MAPQYFTGNGVITACYLTAIHCIKEVFTVEFRAVVASHAHPGSQWTAQFGSGEGVESGML